MTIAKWLFFIGLGFIAIAIIVYFLIKMGIPLGKMPGDLKFEGEKYRVYFPIVTSIVISIILTILLNLLFWLFRR